MRLLILKINTYIEECNKIDNNAMAIKRNVIEFGRTLVHLSSYRACTVFWSVMYPGG